MDSNRLCSVCLDSAATSFCTCSGLAPVLLCDSHVPEHIFKDRSRIHQLLPINALNLRSTSHYDSFKARQDAIVLGREELMDSVRRLDRCVEEFTAKVQEMMNALSEYWTVKNAELQGVREQLVASIEEAVKEAEETIYEETPDLRCKLSKSLREFQRGSKSLRLFEYSLDASNYSSSLNSTLIITTSQHDSETPVLPLLSLQGITLYNVTESKLGNELIHPLLAANQETTLCQVDLDSLLVVNCHNVCLLEITANKCYSKQPTCRSRRSAGAIKYRNQVYVFGGVGEKSAEKFDLNRNTWQRLGDMSRSLSNFVPTAYQHAVYLMDLGCGEDRIAQVCNCSICQEEKPARAPGNPQYQQSSHFPSELPMNPRQKVQAPRPALRLEVFSFDSETFKTLDVTLPENTVAMESVAFVCAEELVLVSASNQVYHWKVDSKTTGFLVSIFPQLGAAAHLQPSPMQSGFSQMQPIYPYMQQRLPKAKLGMQAGETASLRSTLIAHAGKHYWFNSMSLQISIYDDESKSLTTKEI